MVNTLWKLFHSYMIRHRPTEFSSTIGGEAGWKETFNHYITKPFDTWPESMMFWMVQLRNSH